MTLNGKPILYFICAKNKRQNAFVRLYIFDIEMVPGRCILEHNFLQHQPTKMNVRKKERKIERTSEREKEKERDRARVSEKNTEKCRVKVLWDWFVWFSAYFCFGSSVDSQRFHLYWFFTSILPECQWNTKIKCAAQPERQLRLRWCVCVYFELILIEVWTGKQCFVIQFTYFQYWRQRRSAAK